jgi:hypothetical protein
MGIEYEADRMSVFLVETYVIKPDKQAEFTAYKKKWKKFFAKWLKELKSYKMLTQLFGGNYGGYVEMWEFEDMANLEQFYGRVMHSDYPTKLQPEFLSLLVPGAYSMSIWNPVE